MRTTVFIRPILQLLARFPACSRDRNVFPLGDTSRAERALLTTCRFVSTTAQDQDDAATTQITDGASDENAKKDAMFELERVLLGTRPMSSERRKLARMVKKGLLDGPGQTPETLLLAGRLLVGQRKYGEAAQRFIGIMRKGDSPDNKCPPEVVASAAVGLAALHLLENADVFKCYRSLNAARQKHRQCLERDAVFWFNMTMVAATAAREAHTIGHDERASRYMQIASTAAEKASALGNPGVHALLDVVKEHVPTYTAQDETAA